MMNKYIELELIPTPNGIGGSFLSVASFKLDNILPAFHNIPVKIDTGCSISTIPLAKFQPLKLFCESLKSADIKKNIPYEISYGVESSGHKHERPVTYNEKMQCTALKFQHTILNLQIAGVPIDNQTIYVNYNRKGNILIGMDILQHWDIHMEISKATGKNLLLACPQNQLYPETTFSKSDAGCLHSGQIKSAGISSPSYT